MVLATAALLLQLSPFSAVFEKPLPSVQSSQATLKTFAMSSPAPSLTTPTEAEALFASSTDPIGSGLSGGGSQSSATSGLTETSFSPAVRSPGALSLIRIATPAPKATRFVSPDSLPSRRKWIALLLAEHAAATFDAASTRVAISQGAVEADPLMRPFAQSPLIYGAIQVAPVALDFVARRMQRSPRGYLDRTWWVPQAVATGMFFISGVHNLHVASELH
jgi:hypothetical protein